MRIAASSNTPPDWTRDAVNAFDTIAKAEKTRAEIAKDMAMLEQGTGFNSATFGIARTSRRSNAQRWRRARCSTWSGVVLVPGSMSISA